MKFQVWHWEVEDVPENHLPGDLVNERVRHSSKRKRDDDEDVEDRMMYSVMMYGRTMDGKSVAVRATNFTPFFYFRIEGVPKFKGIDMRKIACEHVLAHVKGSYSEEFRGASLKRKTEFFGFTAEQKTDFVSLSFDSQRAMKLAARKLRAVDGAFVNVAGAKRQIKLYESRIEPLSRMLHSRDIHSCGWIDVPDEKTFASKWGTADICIDVSYKDLHPVTVDAVAPMVISSFDIECTSCCGEFPVAIKTYRKLANNIKDLVTSAAELGADKRTIKHLIPAAVLLTMRLPLSGDEEKAVQWVKDRSPYAVSEKKLGFIIPKKQITEDFVLDFLSKRIDDIMAYSTGEVEYVNKKMPRTTVEQIESCFSGFGVDFEGDPIIQIGVTTNRIGDQSCYRKWISTLRGCEQVEGTEVEAFDTEEEMIMAFADHVADANPDIMTGYNIFGFDYKYIVERTIELGIEGQFMAKVSRRPTKPAEFVQKKLSSSALGDNIFWLIETPGRIAVDLMRVVMRDHKLESYKLDNVAFQFTGEKKRDVSPKDIFRLQDGTDADRAVIADYCIQDCVLCNFLMEKLKVIINATAMASLSFVPLSYIFMRGQGVKILSMVSYYCRKRDMLIKDLPKPVSEVDEDAPMWMQKRYTEDKAALTLYDTEDRVDLQGAIVLEPTVGFYAEDPVAVCDYASLYPSSILSHGISPDARVTEDSLRNLPDYDYVDVKYELYDGDKNNKRVIGYETLTFARKKNADVMDPDTLSIIPAIERILLAGRKSIRKKIGHKKAVLKDGRTLIGEYKSKEGNHSIGGQQFTDDELAEPVSDAYSDFMKAVFDGQQLSYKLQANSVYGQLGARTSDIRDPKLAACVTAVGRSLILSAKDFIHDRGGTVVYGDTDSVFFTFPVFDEVTGERLKGAAALPGVIEKAKEVGKAFTATIPAPHDLEYEKTFWPLLLLAKKKYVGNLYEDDPNKFYLKYMGVVLKRRDNAPIVRRVVKEMLDTLLKSLNVKDAIDDMMTVIDELIAGKVGMDELVITKTLRAEYKDRSKIAHAVLAQRHGDRSPGDAFQVNDRIPMVHIRVDKGKKNVLQGEKVETPEYVEENNLEIDYLYYLEDQIMRPTLQMLGSLVEQIPGHNKPQAYWKDLHRKYSLMYERQTNNEEEVKKRVREAMDSARQDEVKKLVFEPKLAKLRNKYNKQRDLISMGFFK